MRVVREARPRIHLVHFPVIKRSELHCIISAQIAYRFFISLLHVISFSCGLFKLAPRMPMNMAAMTSTTIFKLVDSQKLAHSREVQDGNSHLVVMFLQSCLGPSGTKDLYPNVQAEQLAMLFHEVRTHVRRQSTRLVRDKFSSYSVRNALILRTMKHHHDRC